MNRFFDEGMNEMEVSKAMRTNMVYHVGADHDNLPSDDPKQRQPDISLAKEKLSWEPTVQLREGLIKTIEYFKTKI